MFAMATSPPHPRTKSVPLCLVDVANTAAGMSNTPPPTNTHPVTLLAPPRRSKPKKVLQQQISDLNAMINAEDVFGLMFRLRGSLSRNQHGMLHEGLFSRAHAGTKVFQSTCKPQGLGGEWRFREMMMISKVGMLGVACILLLCRQTPSPGFWVSFSQVFQGGAQLCVAIAPTLLSVLLLGVELLSSLPTRCWSSGTTRWSARPSTTSAPRTRWHRISPPTPSSRFSTRPGKHASEHDGRARSVLSPFSFAAAPLARLLPPPLRGTWQGNNDSTLHRPYRHSQIVTDAPVLALTTRFLSPTPLCAILFHACNCHIPVSPRLGLFFFFCRVFASRLASSANSLSKHACDSIPSTLDGGPPLCPASAGAPPFNFECDVPTFVFFVFAEGMKPFLDLIGHPVDAVIG